jgi:L-2,4-diaminobutyrate decarboxylase
VIKYRKKADKMNEKLKECYDSDKFRIMGHQLIDELADYLKTVGSAEMTSVLPGIPPEQMMAGWPADFETEGKGRFMEMTTALIRQSNHLHHPHYIGHQCTAPLPMAALLDFVGSFLNNGSAIYEMGPVNVIMERRLIEWMAQLANFGKQADGVFTSGGTIGNLTALLAARQIQAGYNIWQDGAWHNQPLAILASAQAHYSVKRAAAVMGLGESGCISVAVDQNFKMTLPALSAQLEQAQKNKIKIMAVVANCCSTATGSYDPLEEIADFCRKHQLWLHVDGAHGASALLSQKYRVLLTGIEHADSLVWDAHKMMLMPSLTTAVIFKNGRHSYSAFSQEASYLFENQPQDEWFNYAHRTMECTKIMMGAKLYMCVKLLGTRYFSDYIDYTYDLTREFAGLIQSTADFQLLCPPESNIICFRFIRPGMNTLALNQLQKQIRQQLLKTEKFYLVQANLQGELYLRCTIINPLTRLADLEDLLKEIARMAAFLEKTNGWLAGQ